MRKNSTPLPILMNNEQFDAKVVAKNFGIVFTPLASFAATEKHSTE